MTKRANVRAIGILGYDGVQALDLVGPADADDALAAEGIPYVFRAFRFFGFGKDFEMDRHPDERRSMSLPMDDTVLAFRD